MNNLLDIIINEIKIIYKLNDEYVLMLKNSIHKRIEYYKDYIPNFNDEPLYIKNSTTFEHLLLNRLLNNVIDYKYIKVYNPNSIMNNYDINNYIFSYAEKKLIEETTKNKLKNRISNVDEDTVNTSLERILTKEFSNIYLSVISKKTFNERHDLLINTLISKYPNTFQRPNQDNENKIIKNGIIPIPKDDISKYYSKKETINLLNEIFIEDEVQEIIGNITIHEKYYYENKYYKNITNFESQNYKITSYARILKLILGKNKTRRIMYENPIELYEFFDQFKQVATETFKNNLESKKPVVSCILDALYNIKTNNSVNDALKLDMFLAKCYEYRINYILKTNITEEEKKQIKLDIKTIVSLVMKNDEGLLAHDEILLNIIHKIENKY